MERPKEVVWLEAIALIEFGLSAGLAVFDPIEDSYLWLNVGVAVLILAVTLGFTRWRNAIARRALIVLSGLGIPAGLYVLYLDVQLQPEEIKWHFAYLTIAIVSLMLLLSRSCKEWPNARHEQTFAAGRDDA